MNKRMNIKLSNLYLDLKNPRFEEQASQQQALNTMATEQGDKLLKLLVDIIENGLNPTDLPIVMPADEKGFIVLEGNRRIAALKLLRKPGILSDKLLLKKYTRLHDQHYGRAPKQIECVVVSTRKEAEVWIERKHEGMLDGVGTIPWTSIQKDRFMANKTGKGSKVLQLVEFMKAATEGDEAFAAQLQRVSATNLDRLLSSREVRDDLGITFIKGEFLAKYHPDEVMKGLRYVVSRLSDEDFTVGMIYTKLDRMRFLNNMPSDYKPDSSRKIDTPWKLKDFKELWKDNETSNDNGNQNGNGNEGQNDNDNESGNKNGNQKGDGIVGEQRPTRRETLIPARLALNILNERINRMFVEMKSLDLNDTPNICAVMMRVFVEWSMDCFIETYNLKNEKQLNPNYRRSIREKFSDVLEKLKTLHVAHPDYYKGMETAFSEEASSIFSFHTLNAYVHNNSFNPIPSELMLSWDNAQPFIEALWKAVSEKQNKNKEK